MIIPSDTIFGTRAIAAYLAVYQMQALRLLRAGKVRGQFVSGRWVARESDLDTYVESIRAHEVRP